MRSRRNNGWMWLGLLTLLGCTFTQASGQDKAAGKAENRPAAEGSGRRDDGKSAQNADSRRKRLALLVGCTEYASPDISDLEGPVNDVRLMQQLLVDYYKFRNEDIATLAENAGEGRLPTRANIMAELNRIETAAGRGDQVFLHFSGHGTQQPDQDLDPENDLEPDGLDELFLPRDTGEWDDATGTLANVILDDDLREIIGRITQKGAAVWAVFDCCCSGTIARASPLAEANREVKREVLPSQLVPLEALDRARAEAKKQYGASRGSLAEIDAWDAQPPSVGGGLAATYAALPYQPTVEMFFPLDAEDPVNQTSYGLLTYTIYSILSQAQSNITYSELEQRINQQYARWGRSYPTSLVEGAHRDRLVLDHDGGQRVTRILLDVKPDGTLWINAGAIHGLTLGSMLKVKPPAGGADGETSLGCVKVVGLQPLSAEVEPEEYEDLPAADIEKLQSECRAEIVFLDYRLDKKKLAFWPDDASAAAAKSAGPTLANGVARSGALFELTADPQRADWIVQVRNGSAYLHRAGGLVIDREARDGDAAPPSLDAFGPAAVDDKLASWITTSIQRIARAEAILSMSTPHEASIAGDGVRVDVEMLKYKDARDRQGEIIRGGNAFFQPGDLVGFRITNTGREAVDVTLLYVDSGYGVQSFFPKPGTISDNTIEPRKSVTKRFQVTSDTLGLERIVVIAIKHEGAPIDFSWVEQPTIEQARQAFVRTRGEGETRTPLDQLLERAAYQAGGTRGLRSIDLDQHAIQSLSWTVVVE